MPKQSLSLPPKGKAPSSHQRRGRRVMLVLAIGLCLLAALGIAAQQPARKAPRKAAPRADTAKVVAQTGFSPTTPAKEYIYAGGKLVATEEPTVFTDVSSTDPFYADILKIAAREVTVGCHLPGEPPRYCPNGLVTRAQMAAFIMRALGVHFPPTPAQQRFADVPPTHVFYAHIEEMARPERTITLGCGGGNYCPDGNVTHAQMAAFMSRATGETDAERNSAPLPSQTFCDVAPDWGIFYRFIDYYVNRLGVWPGCGAIPGNDRDVTCTENCPCKAYCPPPARNFCPNCSVTRGEMAYILVRTFNL